LRFSDFQLDGRLQRAVEAAGYSETTPIQGAAIPAALHGRDIVGTAQTGTGKTAAFVLPLLQALLNSPTKPRRVRALIVAPTRELAEQVHAVVRQLSRFTKLRSATVYGGVGMEPQRRALVAGTDIIVACPGRLLDHLGRGNADLSGVEVLVLDEADRMLDMGFLPSVRDIVRRTPTRRHTMLFSATFAAELDELASQILRTPKRVEIGVAAPADTVEHTVYPVHQQQKTEVLLKLLDQTDTESVLIFTRTKHRADRVAENIKRSGYRATVLHSNKSQNERQRALDGFRSGQYQLLVATDIAARGLDIATISHVINYDIPSSADDYIHRIGRTGRMARTGDALTLVTADDRDTVRDIERVLGEPLPVGKVDGYVYNGPPISAPVALRGARPSAKPTPQVQRAPRQGRRRRRSA